MIVFISIFSSSLIKFISTGIISNKVDIPCLNSLKPHSLSITVVYLILEFYYVNIDRNIILTVILFNVVVCLFFNFKKQT